MTDSASTTLEMKVFEHLFEEHREMLERLAYFYIGNHEEARDIVSNCFMVLWEKRESIIPGQLLPYLFTSVKNACVDYRRKEAVRSRVFGSIARKEKDMFDIYTSTIESRDPISLFTNEILSICRNTLMAMPAQQRETWLKHRIEGMSYNEIAEIMKIPRKKVDKNMQKVMKNLKFALAEYIPVIAAFMINHNL
ncbi:MAG: sigma-70 family RNA polymerase sigma factor [Bacteroidales bacterium]|nr:sigma-70 family RNA polymerase sigma factor [Bacteroidales bacterium]